MDALKKYNKLQEKYREQDKADFNDLVARVEATEKRNHEQDDRLTNNELRIEKLEKMISDPMERIMALEQAVANLNLELNNRPTV